MKYDLKDVPNVAIVFMLVAVFFVIAIIILTSLGNNSNFYTSTTTVNESFTMPADEGSITLSNGYVTSLVTVVNASDATFAAANYTLLSTDLNDFGTVKFTDNSSVCKTGFTCRITYVYNDHTTNSGSAITSSITAMSEIPNNWLLLIAVVLAASIIIGIVIKNLGGSERI